MGGPGGTGDAGMGGRRGPRNACPFVAVCTQVRARGDRRVENAKRPNEAPTWGRERLARRRPRPETSSDKGAPVFHATDVPKKVMFRLSGNISTIDVAISGPK